MNPNEPPKDHVDEPGAYDGSLDDESGGKATWKRALFMVIFAIIFWLGVMVGVVVVLLQFFWVLFTGETQKEFSAIGRQLGEYGREIALYMTFNTEERPFPFERDWPSG